MISNLYSKGIVHSTFDFLHSAFDSDLVIADFVSFEQDIKQLFEATKKIDSGYLTTYTDYLSKQKS